MKLLKRITAVMAALLIVVNIAAVNIFAVFAAPVAGEEILEILIALALSAGHSQSELSVMDVTQMQSLVTDDIRSGRLTVDTPIVDPITGAQLAFYDFLRSDTGQAIPVVLQAAAYNFVDDVLTDNSVDLYFTQTSTFDMYGYGACIRYKDIDGFIKCRYCQYLVINPEKVNSSGNDLVTAFGPCQVYNEHSYSFSAVDDTTRTWYPNVLGFYGDVRYLDGSEYPVDDIFVYPLGEVDGTTVTVDMLNPDGTVTIDGVTYDPADYLDPDNLTEEGKNALANAIADAIDNTYVKAEDEPIVDVDSITIEIAEDLKDYAVPVGISNVFPFCIPRDIVRGFKLLNQPAVSPKFEIPFNIPAFGLFPGVENSITLDFTKYNSYIQIFRWFQLTGFSFLLCKLSLTRVKGAGA